MKKTFLLLSLALACAGLTSCQNQAKAETAPLLSETAGADVVPSNVKTLDASLKGADVIKAIKANYPDQVVLIDIWATWCPPCRAAMKEIDAIKPALQEKGVVFVYLTGETSPMIKWKEMIPNISGDHYRLSKDQWQDMCESLHIPGIPAYTILNKDGSTAFSNLTEGGYPGNDVIQNYLEVALSK